jgi:CRP-like cAMP-binding protein
MTAKEAGDVLARNAVFAVLSPQRRKMLVQMGGLIQLSKGSKLFKRGEHADCAYAILSGEIEITAEGPDGRSVFLARLAAGTVVGEMGVLDGVPRAADAHATRRTELWKIDAGIVHKALEEEPGAALALLGVLARRIRDTDLLVERNASMDLGKRLARTLLEEGANGRIIYNQSDLAHLVSATREAVNRKLSQWRKENWVEINQTGLHILDRHALLALCKRKTPL